MLPDYALVEIFDCHLDQAQRMTRMAYAGARVSKMEWRKPLFLGLPGDLSQIQAMW
jgi:hypothetical protein